jgi:hypothetical protein
MRKLCKPTQLADGLDLCYASRSRNGWLSLGWLADNTIQ